MKKWLGLSLLAVFASALPAPAYATLHVTGYVKCDANGSGVRDEGDVLLPGVTVTVTGSGFSVTTTTGEDGFYAVALPAEGAYAVAVTPPNGAAVLSPASNPFPFTISAAAPQLNVNFFLEVGACSGTDTPRCWLTGGGAKFNAVAGTTVAEHGPQHSFGGNVNPGCNEDSGEGGQWNHVAHALKMHFQGLAIQVVRCGNIEDHPPGSESPVTPFNFIEFEGTGVLKGIHGNRMPTEQVTFFARAEDRNEPGSHGAKDGALVDRYFLRVTNGAGVVRLLISTNADPSVVAPVSITDGNLQIHISSCSTP